MRGARQCASSVFVGDRIAREQQSRALREQTFFKDQEGPLRRSSYIRPYLRVPANAEGRLQGMRGAVSMIFESQV